MIKGLHIVSLFKSTSLHLLNKMIILTQSYSLQLLGKHIIKWSLLKDKCVSKLFKNLRMNFELFFDQTTF
jgi:hypothetical protein